MLEPSSMSSIEFTADLFYRKESVYVPHEGYVKVDLSPSNDRKRSNLWVDASAKESEGERAGERERKR